MKVRATQDGYLGKPFVKIGKRIKRGKEFDHPGVELNKAGEVVYSTTKKRSKWLVSLETPKSAKELREEKIDKETSEPHKEVAMSEITKKNTSGKVT